MAPNDYGCRRPRVREPRSYFNALGQSAQTRSTGDRLGPTLRGVASNNIDRSQADRD